MNNEEKILEILVQMQQEQQITNKRLEGLESGQAELKADVARLQKDIDGIKTDVKYVWEDVERIGDRLNVQEVIIQKKIM